MVSARSSTSPRWRRGFPGDGPYQKLRRWCAARLRWFEAAGHLTWCAATICSAANIAVNARPVTADRPPGLSYYRTKFDSTSPDDEFARAAVELALVDTNKVTGQTIGHLEVLDGSFSPFANIETAIGLLRRAGA